MTKLSVNINKIATLRNARGGNVPNLLKVATDIQNLVPKELRYIHVR
jgi:pyridoxine 5-phosphate synthase